MALERAHDSLHLDATTSAFPTTTHQYGLDLPAHIHSHRVYFHANLRSLSLAIFCFVRERKSDKAHCSASRSTVDSHLAKLSRSRGSRSSPHHSSQSHLRSCCLSATEHAWYRYAMLPCLLSLLLLTSQSNGFYHNHISHRTHDTTPRTRLLVTPHTAVTSQHI